MLVPPNNLYQIAKIVAENGGSVLCNLSKSKVLVWGEIKTPESGFMGIWI